MTADHTNSLYTTMNCGLERTKVKYTNKDDVMSNCSRRATS